MLDRRQDPHFVNRVLSLLLRQIIQPHLLQSIDLSISYPLDSVDLAVRAVT
jgi:hypothetical protein